MITQQGPKGLRGRRRSLQNHDFWPTHAGLKMAESSLVGPLFGTLVIGQGVQKEKKGGMGSASQLMPRPNQKQQFRGFQGAHGPGYMGLAANAWVPMGARVHVWLCLLIQEGGVLLLWWVLQITLKRCCKIEHTHRHPLPPLFGGHLRGYPNG